MEHVLLLTITEDNAEMYALLETLDVKVTKEFIQKRDRPHKTEFLGPGKLDEIEKEIKDLSFDTIVVNGVLKPSQHHYLEMRFQKECIDRPGIILRIFSDHAHTPEAIAQVTLAKLRYEQPFLREWIHKAKKGDRPGFLAGGAYATDVYYEHAKSHARRIESNLKELSRQREITRTKRHSKGYSLVSLAGYTNAGKSALFNKLCRAEVEVDSRLFSTLSTTTRKVLKVPGNVLMVDTVGFIRDLPPDLIDAFNSTLEEIFYADLILLVLDSGETIDMIRKKLRTSIDILLPKIEHQVMVVVANKIDLLSEDDRKKLVSGISEGVKPYDMVLVSAETGEGLDQLREVIASIQKRNCLIEGILPIADETYSLLSSLRSSCSVNEKMMDGGIAVTIHCKQEDAEKIRGWLEKAGGLQIVVQCEGAQNEPAQSSALSNGSEGAPL